MALDTSQRDQLAELRSRLQLEARLDDALVQLVIRIPSSMRDAVHAAAETAGAASTQVWLEQVLLEAIQAETVPIWHVARQHEREAIARLRAWVDAGGVEDDLAAIDDLLDDDTRV
jgi:hypothetical protein